MSFVKPVNLSIRNSPKWRDMAVVGAEILDMGTVGVAVEEVVVHPMYSG
jgi:hypothetical protein